MKTSNWILFDVHDTLISSGIYSSIYAPIITRLVNKGIPFTKLNNEINKIKEKTGTIRADSYEICNTFNALDIYYQEFAKLINTLPMLTEIQRLFDAIREMGKRIGIISNSHSRTVKLLLEHHGLLDFVDWIFCKEHAENNKKTGVGYWKKLYIEKKIDPTTTLVIDNDEYSIKSAKECGFKTLQVNGLIDYNIISKIV